jgi:hypothetical protein
MMDQIMLIAVRSASNRKRVTAHRNTLPRVHDAHRLALTKCHDCSKFVCANCRESHLREAFNQLSAVVSQLRRSLPKLSEKIASYEQRVAAIRSNDEQIRREIALAISNLIAELKHRETTLLTEAEVYTQSQLR